MNEIHTQRGEMAKQPADFSPQTLDSSTAQGEPFLVLEDGVPVVRWTGGEAKSLSSGSSSDSSSGEAPDKALKALAALKQTSRKKPQSVPDLGAEKDTGPTGIALPEKSLDAELSVLTPESGPDRKSKGEEPLGLDQDTRVETVLEPEPAPKPAPTPEPEPEIAPAPEKTTAPPEKTRTAVEEPPPASGLRIENIGKRYKKHPVLRNVSLHVQRGEAIGLLGPNGAGKTTCFYIVSGLTHADSGQIFLDGEEITTLPMYRRARLGIGYLPQEPSIFRGLTVEENILAVLETLEADPRQRKSELNSLLEEFSISHLRDSSAISLSGGERRRLEIARALASHPHFILLDEPLAGIDPVAVNDIRELILHLKERGIGVLITDHNVRETLALVDRAYILHDGLVISKGAPADIVQDEEVRRVYLGKRFTLG